MGKGMKKYTIQNGDTLSGIALKTYGDAEKWPAIWRANIGTLTAEQNKTARGMRNMNGPNWIFSGTVIVLPKPPTQTASQAKTP